jgi:outer membrane protein TolC
MVVVAAATLSQAAGQEAEPVLPPPRPVPAADQPKLTLDDVLLSVAAFYPLVRAAEQEREIASGQQLAAQSAFDTNLFGSGYDQSGTYESQRLDSGLFQPTPYLGASLFAGYRLSSPGDFPTYYLQRKTAEGGEFRAGVVVPLLRDRAFDKRRAQVQQGTITRALAEPTVHGQRLEIARNAARAYWSWTAAGHRLRIARRILDIALVRDGQLAELIKQGRLAPIERTDNERSIADRRARLHVAERAFQQTAILLSLYLRDAQGAPRIPECELVPWFPEPPAFPCDDQLDADLEIALRNRPELRRLILLRERAQVDLRLAENQTLPGVAVSLTGAQDMGYGKSSLSGPNGLDRRNYEAALLVDVPLQRREARGRAQSARATLAQLLAQEQFARDRIRADLQDAVSAMRQAAQVRGRAVEGIRLNEEMEKAEVAKFRQGQSNLLFVTIREMMTAEAQALEVDALADVHRAYADYVAALGIDPTAPLDGAAGMGDAGAPCP